MYSLERGKIDRALSAAIVITGLATAAAGAEYARSAYELLSSSGTQAEGAHNITANLGSAEYALTYHPAYSSMALIGKIPVSQYHPPVYSDTSAGRARIESAVGLMEVFPSDTQESRQILRQAESHLPENVVGSDTYSNEIRDISIGRQRFIEKLNPDLMERFVNYQDIVNRRVWAAVGGLTSGAVFLGLLIGAALAGEVSGVKQDVQDFLRVGTRASRRRDQ
jgi:hypothetical protein